MTEDSDSGLHDSSLTRPFKSGLNENVGRKEGINEIGKQ